MKVKATYRVKVHSSDGRYVGVTIFGDRGMIDETSLNRKYFPQERLRRGQIYEMQLQVEITKVTPRELTEEELRRIEAGVRRRLKGIDLDKI